MPIFPFATVPRVLIAAVAIFTILGVSWHSAAAHQSQMSSDRTVRLGPDGKDSPSTSRRWALLIGVDKYDDPEIAPLGGAARDAKALADALVAYAGFPKDQVTVLSSDSTEPPTRGTILRHLAQLRNVVPQDGLLLIGFSGHGIDRDGVAYLLPSDTQTLSDPLLLEETALSAEAVKKMIRQIGVQQVVMFVDACRNDPTRSRSGGDNVMTDGFSKGFSFETSNQDVQAFVTFYASAVGQRAYEDRTTNQGFFTSAIVEALSGAAATAGGEVTLGELIRYVQHTVPERIRKTRGDGVQQQPFVQMEGRLPDQLIIARTEARPAPAATGAAVSTPAPVVDPAGRKLATEARIKAKNGDYDGAISDFKYAIKLDPENAPQYTKDLATVYSYRATAKYHQANYEASVKDFDEAIKLDPSNARYYHDRGVSYANSGKLDRGLRDLSKAIELDPGAAGAYKIRAQIHDMMGNRKKGDADRETAKSLSESVKAAGPEASADLETRITRSMDEGTRLALAGRFEDAIEAYTQAANLDPKRNAPLILRAHAKLCQGFNTGFWLDYVIVAQRKDKHMGQEDLQRHLNACTESIARNPKSAASFLFRGFLRVAGGDRAGCLEDIDRALSLNPDNDNAYMAKALILLGVDTERSIECATEAIRINSENGSAYFVRSLAYDRAKLFKKAEDDAVKALEADPEQFGTLLRRMRQNSNFENQVPWLP